MNYAKISMPNIGRMWLRQYAAIVFALLLAIAVWMNRPPTLFVNKTANNQKKIVQYQVCVIQHRWGTQTICLAPEEYSMAEFELYVYNNNMKASSLKQRWQSVMQH